MEGSNILFSLQNSSGNMEEFIEIYRRFGQAPSKKFASLGLGLSSRERGEDLGIKITTEVGRI
jgi:hypothetical protein